MSDKETKSKKTEEAKNFTFLIGYQAKVLTGETKIGSLQIETKEIPTKKEIGEKLETLLEGVLHFNILGITKFTDEEFNTFNL